MGYSFRLTARVLLYASSHRQASTYNGLCYTWLEREITRWVHHKGSIRTLLPLSYISCSLGVIRYLREIKITYLCKIKGNGTIGLGGINNIVKTIQQIFQKAFYPVKILKKLAKVYLKARLINLLE